MESRRKFMKGAAGASLLGTVGLSGCIGSITGSGGGTTTIRAATVFNQDHIQARILKRGVENFIESAKGNYELNLLAGSIGGEEDQMESAASGNIEMHSTSFGGLTNRYASQYGFMSAPFVAQDWEHVQAMEDKFLRGDDSLNSVLINDGSQRVMRGAYRGIRHTTSNKPIRKPEDIAGVPMRLPEIGSWIAPWKKIGVDVTPVQADELYSALQTGVVEASEGPIGQFTDFSLYEVQSHFSHTSHMVQAYAQVVNEDFWQGLGDDQETLRTAIDDAVNWGYDTLQSDFDKLTQMVQDDHGTTVVTDVDTKAFQEAAAPEIERLFEEKWKVSYDEVSSLA